MTSRSKTTAILDIETIPIGWLDVRDSLGRFKVPPAFLDVALRATQDLRAPDNYGSEAAAAFLARKRAEHLAAAPKLWADQSVDPSRAEVLCVGIRVVGESPVVVWGDDELDTLRQLDRTLADLYADGIRTIVGWRINGFDGPFLWRRAVIARLPRLARAMRPLPYAARMALGVREQPPFTIVDIAEHWAQIRPYRGYAPLAHLRDVLADLGISSDNPITGGDVAAHMVATANGDQVVREHLLSDLADTLDVWCAVAPALGLDIS